MKFSYPSGSTPLEGYTIKRGIGIGGFGEVYFALNDAGKEVALKKIQRNLDVELRGVRQCLNLKHVNLISLWDIRSNEYGESWVVMEYVPGPSLRDAVEASPTGMPEEQAKIWFASTASGVAYLHEHGIVHRDLKPGNIFCDEDEQVIKIGDYGLSKFISCSRRSGQTESVGTFHYMAPEIGKGVYGKEIDIYALGIILYEILTGLVPFDGESTQEIIMKHLTADPDVGVVPEEFRKVISKALRKDPELRYGSVPEMVADLPWPEIAAKSQRIISQHSVGPMVHGAPDRISGKRPTEGRPRGASEARTLGSQPVVAERKLAFDASKLPPVIIRAEEVKVVPGIVFGKLTDNSHYPTGTDSGGAQPQSSPGSELGRVLPHSIQSDVNPESAGNGADIRMSEVRLSHATASNEVVAVGVRDVPLQIVDDALLNGAAIATRGEIESNEAVPGEEPIATVLHTGVNRLNQWWDNANVSTPVKMILLIIVGIVVVQNSQWLLPLTVGLGLVYLVYYLARTWLLISGKEPRPLSRRQIQMQKNFQVRQHLAAMPSGDRVTELVGALLIGALACIVLNLLGVALGGGILNSSVENWAKFAWLTLNSTLACWVLLICSKCWEPREGNGWFRRGVMLAIGVGLGMIAFFSAASFEQNLTTLATEDFAMLSTQRFVLNDVPIFPAYLIFFGGLFGVLRWWKQTDSLRSTRLSLWSVSLCLIWATLFSHLLNVPLVVNCVLVVVIAVASQLASPWLHPALRDEICSEHSSS